jgi:hypothetical protein
MDARQDHARKIFDLGLLRLEKDKPDVGKPPIDAINGRGSPIPQPRDAKGNTH